MSTEEEHISDEEKADFIPAEETGPAEQVIVFKVGNEEYALMIELIKEVVLTPPVTKVPLMPSYIRGLANIRGNIVSVIDLEEKLNIRTKDRQENKEVPRYALVIEDDEMKVAVLSREVPGTVSVPAGAIDTSPDLVQENYGNKSYIKGVVRTGERLIILIDIFKLLE